MRKVLYLMAFLIPIVIFPQIIENAFFTPKLLLMMIGASILTIMGLDRLKSLPLVVKLLIAFNLFSLFYTLNPYYTKVAVVFNVSCLLVYFITSRAFTESKTVIRLMAVILITGVLVSALTWCQYFDHYLLMPWIKKESRLYIGTIGNSNYLGTYLLFPLFSALGLIVILKGRWKILPSLAFLLIFGMFILARARSSWIGFFIGIALFISLLWDRKKVSLKAISLGAVILIVWGMVFLNFIPKGTFTKFDSFKVRIYGDFPAAIEVWKQNPLFGTGLWSYRNQVYEAQARIEQRDKGYLSQDFLLIDGPKSREVHNEYLEVLVDGGLVGAFLCAWFIVFVMRPGFAYLKKADPVKKVILSAFMCSIVAVLVGALFFFPFRVMTTAFMFSLSLGVVSGYIQTRKP